MSDVQSGTMERIAPIGQVLLVVGGWYYTLSNELMMKYPDSFFANLVKPEWKVSGANKPIIIDRDGELFQYVFDFLRYGLLPRDTIGRTMMDAATKAAVRAEADFYRLHKLMVECNQKEQSEFSDLLRTYHAVDRTIAGFKEGGADWTVPEDVTDLSQEKNYRNDNSQDRYDMDDDPEMQRKFQMSRSYKQFAKCLRRVVAPFCITGVLDADTYADISIYKSSTVEQLNMAELLAEAILSPFGKGFETVIDTNVRHSYENDLSKDDSCYMLRWAIDVSPLAPPEKDVDIRPYKLVIYKEGGHFEAHRDTVRGEGHIGTLVVILNSEYTGGELEVTHGGRTEVVTGPYHWVAMYGDCLHKINPVTSGTRVSLIYDIYSIRPMNAGKDEWTAPYYSSIPINTIPRGADETQKQAVIEGMHQQLRGFDSAVICLQHLYPACQANPDFLKGGDQLLYDILRDHFTLAVLPCTIYRRKYYPYADDYTDENNKLVVQPLRLLCLPDKNVAFASAAGKLKTNFIVFDHFTRDHVVLDEEIDYTGNESQGRETVYMVAGLQVREKRV